eukprot:scaffold13818_cov79-Isochrysis_galbana.AAC.1
MVAYTTSLVGGSGVEEGMPGGEEHAGPPMAAGPRTVKDGVRVESMQNVVWSRLPEKQIEQRFRLAPARAWCGPGCLKGDVSKEKKPQLSPVARVWCSPGCRSRG